MWEYGENKEETECPECDYTAKSKGVISDHICQKQTVAYEKPTCPHCGATFTKNLTSGNTLRKLPVIQNFFTISRMSEKKISLPRDTYCWEEVQGRRYYERNYKGSLTNESELTNQIYRYLMRLLVKSTLDRGKAKSELILVLAKWAQTVCKHISHKIGV